jgi:hypothetical protein
MTQPQQHYDVTDDDFDFIWKNIDSPLVVRDRINVIKTRSNSYQSGRDKVLDELRVIKEYDRIRFHQKHTLPKSWVEVKVTSVSKDGKRIGISGKMPGSGCTTEMCIDISDVRQVCRWIELRQQAGDRE